MAGGQRIIGQQIHHLIPQSQHLLIHIRGCRHTVAIGAQDINGGEFAAVDKRKPCGALKISGDPADITNWIDKAEIGEIGAGFDGVKNQRCHPKLQHHRRVRHVGVADNHMQAPPVLCIRVRLIARINDATVQRGF